MTVPWRSHCPTRGSCRRGPPIAAIACPSPAASWATLRSRWRNCFGHSPGGASSRWWTAYVDHGLEALPRRPHRPPGRLRFVPPGRRASGAAAGTILNEKAPRRWGSPTRCGPRRAVRRVDAARSGSTCRCGPSASTSSGGATTAKVSRVMPRQRRPEEVRRWLEVTYPAIEGAGPPVRMRRSTGATRPHSGRPATASGVTAGEGRPAEDRGDRSPRPHGT